MDLKLPDTIYSSQDLRSINLEIRRYSQWFAQNSIKAKVTSSKAPSAPTLSETTVNIIKEAMNGKALTQKILDETLERVTLLESNSPKITITLAAAAPMSLKIKLVEWCRKNISPNILVDFHFNSTLLGGMVVRYGSHIYDWSLKRQIMASRQKFPEILRHV